MPSEEWQCSPREQVFGKRRKGSDWGVKVLMTSATVWDWVASFTYSKFHSVKYWRVRNRKTLLCQLGTSGVCPLLGEVDIGASSLEAPAFLFLQRKGNNFFAPAFWPGQPSRRQGRCAAFPQRSSGRNLATGFVSRGGQALLARFHQELSRQSAFVNRFGKYSRELPSVCSISDRMDGHLLI